MLVTSPYAVLVLCVKAMQYEQVLSIRLRHIVYDSKQLMCCARLGKATVCAESAGVLDIVPDQIPTSPDLPRALWREHRHRTRQCCKAQDFHVICQQGHGNPAAFRQYGVICGI